MHYGEVNTGDTCVTSFKAIKSTLNFNSNKNLLKV